MPQQTTASTFGQGYMHTAPRFAMSNPGSTPYTSGCNKPAYPNPNGNYQASYTTIAYNDPIPLPSSSLGFLPNHAYQNTPHSNTYSQLETSSFGYETPPQFLFRSQPIDMMPPQAMAELGVDPNNLTNQ
jgi:hypothetical protein